MVLVPNESKAFSVDGIEIHSGSLSPLSGFSAPIGSIYLQSNGSNGALFIKRGSSDTDWNESKNNIKNIITVQKNPSAGEFSSIASAIASIVGSGANNRFAVTIGPGIYDEGQIDVPPYVSILGSDIQSTVIRPISNNQILFNINQGTEIAFVSLDNTSAGYTNVTGVMSDDKGNFSQMHKMSIYGFTTGIFHRSETQDSYLYMEYIDVDDVYNAGIKCESNNGFIAYVNTENWYAFPNAINTGDTVLVDGVDATVDMNAFGINGSGSDNGIRVTNGGSTNMQGGYFVGNNIGVYSDSIGSGSEIIGSGITHLNCVQEIRIDNANTTGSWTGQINHEKLYIDPASSFYIAGKDLQIVTVAKRGGDHSSIKDAIDDITDASISKPYVIEVGPGIFIEPQITMKQFVYVKGSAGDQATIIQALLTTQKTIIGADNSGIENVLITGATDSSGIGIYHEGNGTSVPFIVKSCLFGDNYTQAEVFGNVSTSILQINECRMGGPYNQTNGFKASCNSGIATQLSIENLIFQDVVAPYATGDLINISGATVGLVISGLFARTLVASGYGLIISDGAQARVSGLSLRGFLKGIWAKNVGVAPFVKTLATALEGNTEDIRIDHPGTTGSFFGNATQSKIYKDPAATGFSFLFQDPSNGSLGLSGTIKLGLADNTYQDISTLIIESSTMGVMEGGEITNVSGLTINVASGFGYYEIEPEQIYRYDWPSVNFNVPDNQESYIYFNPSEVLTASNTRPDNNYNILLGRVISVSGTVIIVDNSNLNAEHTVNRLDQMFHDAVGPIYSSGSITTENATPFHLNVTNGKYYFSMNPFSPSGGSNISFYEVYNNSYHGAVNAVQVKYDNAGTLTALSSNKYAKHSLYVANDGANEKYLLVYATQFYNSLLEAENGNIPNPAPGMDDAICLIANIIVRGGGSNIEEILDSRPRLGFKSAGTSASSDHQALSNRDVEAAHPQYLLRNGNNAMTSNLDLGGFTITNNAALPGTTTAPPITNNADVSNTEGVASTKARSDHIHNIPTAVPVSIGTSNTQGSANTFAKSDHIHSHGAQTDPAQHAIATGSANGFMSSSDKTKLDGIGGSRIIKSGLVAGSSFAGNPKTFAVVFSTAFPNTNYSINITGDTNRIFTYQSKATTGFTINANANAAFAAGQVSWTAISTGETIE